MTPPYDQLTFKDRLILDVSVHVVLDVSVHVLCPRINQPRVQRGVVREVFLVKARVVRRVVQLRVISRIVQTRVIGWVVKACVLGVISRVHWAGCMPS